MFFFFYLVQFYWSMIFVIKKYKIKLWSVSNVIVKSSQLLRPNDLKKNSCQCATKPLKYYFMLFLGI
jgi:hypothetical protein